MSVRDEVLDCHCGGKASCQWSLVEDEDFGVHFYKCDKCGLEGDTYLSGVQDAADAWIEMMKRARFVARF